MKNKTQQYRQGDVLVLKVDSIPKLQKTKIVRLANGEITGHHHTICEGAVGYADDETGLAEFVEVEEQEGVDLVHQEHETITLPPGKFRSVIQSQYTPEEIKRVAD
jgi:hypothetical protein